MVKKSKDENIRVCIRSRPLGTNEEPCVDMDAMDGSIKIPTQTDKTFFFDSCYNENFEQEDIFNKEVCPLVEKVLGGFNSTVFAYGQSGSGKTHTISGYPGDPGILPRALSYIFKCISNPSNPKIQFTVSIQFIEIYEEKCHDLLGDGGVVDIKLTKDKQAFHIPDAICPVVTSGEAAFALFEKGNSSRHVGETALNAKSSRSHAVFMASLDSFDPDENRHMVSCLNLVDLAGSERQDQSGASGDRLKEGCQINKSLTILGMCIDAILDSKGGGYVPYRSSALTKILKSSLGGNSRTLMFATIRCPMKFGVETLSTIRFADRVKKVQNKPKKNLDPKDALIESLRSENDDLKAKLKKLKGVEDGDELEDADEQYLQEIDSLRLQLAEQKEKLETEIAELKKQLVETEREITSNPTSTIAQSQVVKEVVKEVVKDAQGKEIVVEKVVEKVVPATAAASAFVQSTAVAQQAIEDCRDQKNELMNLISHFVQSGFLWLKQNVSGAEEQELPTDMDYATASDCLKMVEAGLADSTTQKQKLVEKYEMQQNTILAELNTLKDDVDKSTQENQWLQEQVTSKQQEAEKLADELKLLKRNMTDQKDETNEEVQQMRSEFLKNEDKLRTELAQLGNQVGELTRKVQADAQVIERKQQEIEQSKQGNESREEYWQGEIDRKQKYWDSEKEQLNLQLAALQGEAENQHAEVVNVFSRQMGIHSRLQENHEKEMSKFSALLETFKDLKARETDAHNKQLQKMNHDIERLTVHKNELEATQDQHKADTRELQRELKESAIESKKLMNTNTQLQQLLEEQDTNMVEQKQQYEAQLQAIREESKRLQKEIKQELREVQKELAVTQVEASKLPQYQETINHLTAQKQRLEDELKNKIVAVDAIRKNLQDCRSMDAKIIDEWKMKYDHAVHQQQEIKVKASQQEKKLTTFYERQLQETTEKFKQELLESQKKWTKRKKKLEREFRTQAVDLEQAREDMEKAYSDKVVENQIYQDKLEQEKYERLRERLDDSTKQNIDGQDAYESAIRKSRDAMMAKKKSLMPY